MAVLRALVDPPSFTPIPYGLLTTVEWETATDGHWQNGINYQPMCGVNVTGVGASTYDACIAVTGTGAVTGAGHPPAPAQLLGSTVTTTLRGATSFTTFAEFDCGPIGTDAQATAEKALAMSEPWQVERAFWTGLSGSSGPTSPQGQRTTVFPHLAANAQILDADGVMLQSAAVDVNGGSSIGISGDTTNITTALGLLEGALANCYDGIGVIHVPQFAVPTLASQFTADGPVMKTRNGNMVAIGAGYPGTAPDGSSRGGNNVWLYATGNVFGFRSQVRVRSANANSGAAMDRSTNTIRMIAERTYVLGWDCCHFAIQAALGAPKGT